MLISEPDLRRNNTEYQCLALSLPVGVALIYMSQGSSRLQISPVYLALLPLAVGSPFTVRDECFRTSFSSRAVNGDLTVRAVRKHVLDNADSMNWLCLELFGATSSSSFFVAVY